MINENIAPSNTTDNLAVLVKRLAMALQETDSHHALPGIAMAYLQRNDLEGRTLRRPVPNIAVASASSLPERDQTKSNEQQGVFHKYEVRRVDGSDRPGGKHFGCAYFVLDLDHDKHAPATMRAYAAACRDTHPQLAADIDRKWCSPAASVPGSDSAASTSMHRDMESVNAFEKCRHLE